ncbi:hypothetical protein ACFXG4_48640 [Nocardia sp. NPDC059246]|uniref:hypothetical protein n=1 Tax=unclassified Nocardia TaxID=2637762 RepID=UPI00369A431E
MDGTTSTGTGRIVVQEQFSRGIGLYLRGPGTVVWDTPLWLGSTSLIDQMKSFATDVMRGLALYEAAGAVDSVVDAVARLQRWNAAQAGQMSPAGRLRLPWSQPQVLVVEVWDARRPWPGSLDLMGSGPGYRYFSVTRLRVSTAIVIDTAFPTRGRCSPRRAGPTGPVRGESPTSSEFVAGSSIPPGTRIGSAMT